MKLIISTILLASSLVVACAGNDTYYYRSDMDEAYKFLLFEAAKHEQVNIQEVDEIPWYGSSVTFDTASHFRPIDVSETFTKYILWFDLKKEIHIRKRIIHPQFPELRNKMFNVLSKELRK